jgi:hypothetical protein
MAVLHRTAEFLQPRKAGYTVYARTVTGTENMIAMEHVERGQSII